MKQRLSISLKEIQSYQNKKATEDLSTILNSSKLYNQLKTAEKVFNNEELKETYLKKLISHKIIKKDTSSVQELQHTIIEKTKLTNQTLNNAITKKGASIENTVEYVNEQAENGSRRKDVNYNNAVKDLRELVSGEGIEKKGILYPNSPTTESIYYSLATSLLITGIFYGISMTPGNKIVEMSKNEIMTLVPIGLAILTAFGLIIGTISTGVKDIIYKEFSKEDAKYIDNKIQEIYK